MRLRNTILIGTSSYLQMGSQVLTGLITIPLALHFLDSEHFGLWSFVTQSLGYLLLLDIGVGHALGRLLAEPLHTGNEPEWNGWFNLALIVFGVQAALILAVGWFLADPILHWFAIPVGMFGEAHQLWLMMVAINALMLPLRVFRGIVIAQNRSYWMFGGATLGAWCGLLTFYLFLKAGWGVLAYGWMALVQSGLTVGLPMAATFFGPHRFRLSFWNIPWRHLRELFGYSSAMFIISIAVQVIFMSQSLIITKILGLAAVASFTVSSKVPMLLMQFVWQPFDAFVPRWQIYWAKREQASLREEFRRLFRFTMGLATATMLCCFALNRCFVFVFGKQELYAGETFDFFITLFVMIPVWNHCLSICFTLSKRMKGLALVALINTALFLIAVIVGTKLYGLTGFVAFAAGYSLISVGVMYQTLKGPKLLGLRSRELLRDNGLNLLTFFLLMTTGWLTFHHFTESLPRLVAEITFSGIGVIWFLGFFRQDLLALLRRLQIARQNQRNQLFAMANKRPD